MLVIEGWTVRQFIGNIPIEDFSQEELDSYFEKAVDRAFLAIGYVPVETQTQEKTNT